MDEKGKNLSKIFYPPLKMNYATMLRLADPIGNLTVIYDQDALGKYLVPQIKKEMTLHFGFKYFKILSIVLECRKF